MSIQELLQSEVYNAASEAKKQQRLELQQFLDTRGAADPDGKEFIDFMEKSKMHFGPFAIKLAQEFVQSQIKKKEKTNNPLKKDQEFISFLKMEYFLYGVQEANHIVQQLRFMEDEINNRTETYERMQFDSNAIQNQLRQIPLDSRFAADRKILQQRIQDIGVKVSGSSQEISDNRFEISSKETELLLIFNELISYDFYVPDNHFETSQYDTERKHRRTETYSVPLHNFWRPIEMAEYIEPFLNHPDFQ